MGWGTPRARGVQHRGYGGARQLGTVTNPPVAVGVALWAGGATHTGQTPGSPSGRGGLCRAAQCRGVGRQPPGCRGAGSMAPLPPCRGRERGSVRAAAPLAGADVWFPGMKGLFRRASTLPAPGNRSRGGGGAQPTAGHTMPLCAGHLGRLPWPPATVPTPGAQPDSGRWGVPVCQWELGPRDGQGCRWVEGTGMLRVPPAPGNPDRGSHCPSSPRSPCPVPAGCPQPVLLPPTAPTGLASPAALERGRTHGLSLLGGTAWGHGWGAQNAAAPRWELAKHPVGDAGRWGAGSTGVLWVGRLPRPHG